MSASNGSSNAVLKSVLSGTIDQIRSIIIEGHNFCNVLLDNCYNEVLKKIEDGSCNAVVDGELTDRDNSSPVITSLPVSNQQTEQQQQPQQSPSASQHICPRQESPNGQTPPNVVKVEEETEDVHFIGELSSSSVATQSSEPVVETSTSMTPSSTSPPLTRSKRKSCSSITANSSDISDESKYETIRYRCEYSKCGLIVDATAEEEHVHSDNTKGAFVCLAPNCGRRLCFNSK